MLKCGLGDPEGEGDRDLVLVAGAHISVKQFACVTFAGILPTSNHNLQVIYFLI